MAKSTYTYEDFLKSARQAGMLGILSEADLRLAETDPDAGMSILAYEKDYRDAISDEASSLASAGAARIRSTLGGYTSDITGTGYQQAGESAWDDDYVNPYEAAQQARIAAMSQPFSYDAETDGAYQSYRQAYLREGQRAFEDTLGSAAANTGGVASTAAITAAQQARGYYNAQAADKRAELTQQAYQNWLNGRAQAVSELEALNQLERAAAARHQQAYENRTGAAQREFENNQILYQNDVAEKQRQFEYEQTLYQNDAAKMQQRFENDETVRLGQAAAAQQEFENSQTIYKNEAAAKQQAFENGQTLYKNGTAAAQQAFENSLLLDQTEEAAAQQRFENAMAKWKAYGYVTQDIAEVLALPVGTAYSDQAYDKWYQSFQEASSGIYTGRTLSDTANAQQAITNAIAMAAGDSADGHSQLSRGSAGSEVLTMQRYLRALGYSLGGYSPDGVFGAGTQAAVRSFQSYHGLPVDGICGPLTWAELIGTLQGMQ